MKKLIILTGASFTLFTTSCATIVSGSKQSVKIDSTPNKATIFINDVEVGKTPFEARLERKKDHNIVISLEGYKPYETKLTRKFNAWYLGNILFGGIIGLIVDPSTGAIYNLTPNEINAQMEEGVAFKKSKEGIFIAVSLKVDKNWNKIGQLEQL